MGTRERGPAERTAASAGGKVIKAETDVGTKERKRYVPSSQGILSISLCRVMLLCKKLKNACRVVYVHS